MKSKKFLNKTLDDCLLIALKGKLKMDDAFQLANKVEELAPSPAKKKRAKKKK